MYAVVIPWVIRCSHMQHNNNNNSNAVCIAQIRRKQQMGCSQCPKRKAFSLALNDFLSTCPLTASRSTDCSTLRGRGQKSRGHHSLSSCVEQPADECMQIGEGDVQRPVMSVYIAQSGTAALVRGDT